MILSFKFQRSTTLGYKDGLKNFLTLVCPLIISNIYLIIFLFGFSPPPLITRRLNPTKPADGYLTSGLTRKSENSDVCKTKIYTSTLRPLQED